MMHVLHEDPDAFIRTNGVITHCPCCKTRKTKKLTPRDQFRTEAATVLGNILGDDIDGLASTLEDFGLV
jgi:hypothetical protein